MCRRCAIRLFPDADPEAINADRGPEVEAGIYCWAPQAGQPVAPTVLRKDTPPAADDDLRRTSAAGRRAATLRTPRQNRVLR